MTNFSFENIDSLACSELYTNFLEKIVEEGREYKLVRINACFRLLKEKDLIENSVVVSRREFATITWTIYENIPYLGHAVRAKNALEQIVDFDLFREYCFENTIETFLFYLPFTGCMPTVSMFILQDKLSSHIKVAFDELKEAKETLWKELGQNEKIPCTFTEILKDSRKRLLKNHPDKNLTNLSESQNLFIEFNQKYVACQSILQKYGITSSAIDKLIDM